MLHHVSIGVADVVRAAVFYDSALGALGYRRVLEFLPYAIGYGRHGPEFWVQLPADRRSASAGNGVHIGFKAATQALVDAFHRAALAAGGTDEGRPGPRPDYGPDYYGAFVRDLDGNKLEAVLTSEPRPAKAARAKRKVAKPAVKRGKGAKKRSAIKTGGRKTKRGARRTKR